jgi:hypothetical protein
VRCGARHPSLGQGQDRHLPVGRQHPGPQCPAHLRQQLSAAHPGRPSSTPMPADAASTTLMRSASLAAPGSGSCGPAGTTTPPTTQSDMAPRSASPPELDSGNSSARSLASCSVFWSGKPRPGHAVTAGRVSAQATLSTKGGRDPVDTPTTRGGQRPRRRRRQRPALPGRAAGSCLRRAAPGRCIPAPLQQCPAR